MSLFLKFLLSIFWNLQFPQSFDHITLIITFNTTMISRWHFRIERHWRFDSISHILQSVQFQQRGLHCWKFSGFMHIFRSLNMVWIFSSSYLGRNEVMKSRALDDNANLCIFFWQLKILVARSLNTCYVLFNPMLI